MAGIFYFCIKGTMILVLHTDTPMMAIVSNSMKHMDNSWMSFIHNHYGVDFSTIDNFPVKGGFERGDLIVVKGVSSPEEIKLGDVIVYNSEDSKIPIVHRVVQIENLDGEIFFTTKGDNPRILATEEVSFDNVIGKVVFVIPKLGYLSLLV
ncbi:MAG: signal peptidase I [Hadesarchaea archaeon]|nr:signal peptidase I [Hadesarchaea archaeon]